MALANRTTSETRRSEVDRGRSGDSGRDPRRVGAYRALPTISLLLGALSFIGMMVSIWAIFLYAPTDAIQGQPQRIFYFHVPMAWIALLASGVLAVTIIGFIDVPIIYEAVNWWRGLHPAAVTTPGALPPQMLVTLLISVVTFTLLFSFLMVQLYNLEKMQTLAQRLRASVE